MAPVRSSRDDRAEEIRSHSSARSPFGSTASSTQCSGPPCHPRSPELIADLLPTEPRPPGPPDWLAEIERGNRTRREAEQPHVAALRAFCHALNNEQQRFEAPDRFSHGPMAGFGPLDGPGSFPGGPGDEPGPRSGGLVSSGQWAGRGRSLRESIPYPRPWHQSNR